MKKLTLSLTVLVLTLGFATTSWPINFGDILNETLKPPPQKKETAPAPAPQPTPAPEQTQPKGEGGLLGILEGTGVVDQKTGKVLRGAGNLVQSLQPIGWEEERAIGGSLALEVFNRFGGPYQNEHLQRYITLVGQSVVGVSDRANIPYHFAVVNTNHPNAFATPGGYVFVSIGLLRMLHSEAELAGVLGHEVAHVAKRHALQTIERSKTLQGISQVTTSLLDSDPGMLANIVNEMSQTLFTKGLDQNLEFEADKFGMEYAYRVGYHPGGLREFLKLLGRSQASQSVLLSTHPSPRQRYGRLTSQLRGYSDAAKAPVLASRYAQQTKGQL